MTSASEHAELESQLLATQRALVDMYRLVVSVDTGAQQDVAGANWYDARSGYLIAYRSAITAARAVVAQADGKEARS